MADQDNDSRPSSSGSARGRGIVTRIVFKIGEILFEALIEAVVEAIKEEVLSIGEEILEGAKKRLWASRSKRRRGSKSSGRGGRGGPRRHPFKTFWGRTKQGAGTVSGKVRTRYVSTVVRTAEQHWKEFETGTGRYQPRRRPGAAKQDQEPRRALESATEQAAHRSLWKSRR